MKTIRKVPVRLSYVRHIPHVDDMQDGVIYVSVQYDTAIHRCLCGCGNQTVTPLNENGWKLTEENGKITLSPSIGNYNFPCRSHYIITKGIANFV